MRMIYNRFSCVLTVNKLILCRIFSPLVSLFCSVQSTLQPTPGLLDCLLKPYSRGYLRVFQRQSTYRQHDLSFFILPSSAILVFLLRTTDEGQDLAITAEYPPNLRIARHVKRHSGLRRNLRALLYEGHAQAYRLRGRHPRESIQIQTGAIGHRRSTAKTGVFVVILVIALTMGYWAYIAINRRYIPLPWWVLVIDTNDFRHSYSTSHVRPFVQDGTSSTSDMVSDLGNPHDQCLMKVI